jgi:hypothetical protein
MTDKTNLSLSQGDETNFYKQVADLLVQARVFVRQQMDSTIVRTYFELGKMIVTREQLGENRAQYGTELIKGLSKYLAEQYGKGFSVVNLKSIRKFYQVYAPTIEANIQKGQSASALSEPNAQKSQSVISLSDGTIQKGQSLTALFKLTWTHYQLLMRIESEFARRCSCSRSFNFGL